MDFNEREQRVFYIYSPGSDITSSLERDAYLPVCSGDIGIIVHGSTAQSLLRCQLSSVTRWNQRRDLHTVGYRWL
jgi:hypothetical protein